jgi:putative chitobiose transport system permease protein
VIGRRWYVPWLFLLPSLAVLGLFYWWPIANTGVLSFTDAHAIRGGSFIGLDNFIRLAGDPFFRNALQNSVVFALGVVPLLVFLPLFLAVLVNAKLPGMSFFRTVFFSPVVASMVVAALLWGWMLRSDGLFNWFLMQLKILNEPVGWLTDPTLALISVMFVTVWKGLGYYMIIYLAGLQNVPAELHEAAIVDGAGPIRRFWSITVPLLRPIMVLVGTLAAISAVKVFTEVFVLTGGGPRRASQTLVPYIYERGIVGLEMGYASAMSMVLFVLVLGLTLLAGRITRKRAQA